MKLDENVTINGATLEKKTCYCEVSQNRLWYNKKKKNCLFKTDRKPIKGKYHLSVVLNITYCKILNISSRLIDIKHIWGLVFGGLIFGGAFIWRTFCVIYLQNFLSTIHHISVLSILCETYFVWDILFMIHILCETYLMWDTLFVGHNLCETYFGWETFFVRHILCAKRRKNEKLITKTPQSHEAWCSDTREEQN